ncbi:hypothetical protein [uncultured Campylobacter sp.]|uniref:hypothetical protein n=1 Tax=uncultured Campylobacter sp. TaxID=218934 RepID=UPI002635E2BE|nr:hypothetical protein [uncultured Campylobacter sp.]
MKERNFIAYGGSVPKFYRRRIGAFGSPSPQNWNFIAAVTRDQKFYLTAAAQD